MKCPICGGTGNTKNIIGKPLTEQEYLQTCDIEQLAEWITDVVCACREQDDCMDCRLGWCSKKDVIGWLKQPHSWWEK